MKLRRKIFSGLMFTISAITCPCHLPLVLPFVLGLLAETSVAVWLTQNVNLVAGGMSVVFLTSLALGFVQWRRA